MDTIKILRSMAWERAKGELSAMAQTYHGEEGKIEYAKFCDAYTEFVSEVEDHGLQE